MIHDHLISVFLYPTTKVEGFTKLLIKEICLIALVIVAVVILIKISFAIMSIVFQLIEVLAAIGLIYLIIEYFKKKP